MNQQTSHTPESDGIKGVAPVQSVQNIIINCIKGWRKIGYSYREIGKRLNLSSGQVNDIEKGKWYPKRKDIELRILMNLKGGE